MNIYLKSGKGLGKTRIGAFDAALKDAGVYNYNLIRLSSIIPPGSVLHLNENKPTSEDEWGHKLYAVYADARTTEPGKWAGAVVGWIQFADGRGMFTEHEKIGDDGEVLKKELEEEAITTIKNLCISRGLEYDEKNIKTMCQVTQATDTHAAGSVVVASYKSESWR
ncbi:MAG: pyruvoyl-dependent arginine decarboxylase [Patescibacteria group bacterium]